MNLQINNLLTEIRHSFEEEAYGPDGVEPADAAKGAKAGDLGATNLTTVDDDVMQYIGGVVDGLLEEYDLSDDDAYDFVFEIAAAMAEEGMLPLIPAEDDPDTIKAEWLGACKTVGLAAEVLAAAEEVASE